MLGDFSKLVRDLRRERGYSLEFLARESGVSYGTIRHCERGGTPSLYNAEAILKVLGMRLEIVEARRR